MISTTKKTLITGGCGFVGTYLCKRLVSEGYAVVSLDIRDPREKVAGVEYVKGDIRNTKLVQELINDCGSVFHLAATVSVPLCQQDPIESYSNNVQGTISVLDAIVLSAEEKKSKPIPIVFASSAALYGSKGDDGRALKEEDIASEFLSFYAAQKHAGEKAIQVYCSSKNVPAMIFRFFNVYGIGQDPSSPYSGVITLFINRASEGKPLTVFGGGLQTRDFISVYEIAKACSLALNVPLEKWDAQPMNLGTSKTVTVKELAKIISEGFGSKSAVIEGPAREGDVQHSKANVERAEKVLGFKAEIDLKNGLSELFKFNQQGVKQ